MDDNIFDIKWTGLDEYARELQDFQKAFVAALIAEMNSYQNLVVEGARALAFRFGGDLEQSIIAMPVKTQGDTVSGSVGTNLIYAWRLHEKPDKKGSGDLRHNGILIRGYYIDGRGQRTRAKSTWRGMMPGRKYLENAIVATEDDFVTFLDRALIRVIGG